MHLRLSTLIIPLCTALVLCLNPGKTHTQSKNIWVSAPELADRPVTGEAWDRLLKAADSVDTLAVEGGHNSRHDTYTMAAALVAVRLDDDSRRQVVANNIMKAVSQQVENDGNSLSLTRTVTGYVLAADLIDLQTFDAQMDSSFRAWLEYVVYELQLDDATQLDKHEVRGNNHGTQAGVARIAAALYLDKTADVTRAAAVFKGWLGDSASYNGFNWGDLCWQVDPNNPVGILPLGSTMLVAGGLRDVDGVQPDDQRRAGCPADEPSWPPGTDTHVWGGLQGAVGQAYLLGRAGFDAWNWLDQAILRAVSWQQDPIRGNAPATSDDLWILPLIDTFYGTSFWDGYPVGDGKQVGWTDWTHGGDKATRATLRIEKVGKGTVAIQPTGPSYVPGTEVQLTASPAPGWIFIGWGEDLEGLANPQSLVMDEATTVTVIFGEEINTVLVEPKVTTTPTPGDANDPAIWIHPTTPEKSVVIGTDKDKGVYVWDLNGAALQTLPQSSNVNVVDVRRDVDLDGQAVDLVVSNLRDIGKLGVFKVNPDYTDSDVLIQLSDANSINNGIQVDSYGLCLYRRPTDGALFVFERPKRGGILRQYLVTGDGSGGVIVTAARDLNYGGGKAEGLVCDDELGFLYVAEEGEGIHKYYADPTLSPDPIFFFATEDGITSPRHGIGIYSCSDSTGYLVLSSQGNSTFKVYERQQNNQFVKTVVPMDGLANIDLKTEGLDVTSASVHPNFPNGFVVALDKVGSKFQLYDWADLAENDLQICVDGEVTPQPDISVSPSSHDFGSLPLGGMSSQSFAISNHGTADLSVTNAFLLDNVNDEFTIVSGGGSFTLQPGQTRTLLVKFIPITSGRSTAKLRFFSNDPNENPFNVAISGAGFSPTPHIAITPSSHDFGVVEIGRSGVHTFELLNLGTADLSLTSAALQGLNSPNFTMEDFGLPLTLGPGESRAFAVSFIPSFVGNAEGALRISSNDPAQANLDVPLTGTGLVLGPETVTLIPIDDSFVRSTRATTNYNTKTALYVREATGIYVSYLKFSVADLLGSVQSAKLRLFTVDDGDDGGSIHLVSDNYEGSAAPWREDGLTWENAPLISTPPLGALGAVALDAWVEFDVTAAISGDGIYSFAITNKSSEDVKYSSKEGNNPPELVITTSGDIWTPTQLVMISGQGQSGLVDSALANAFVVEARNANNEPVAGASVSFEVASGGGSLSTGGVQVTGTDGRASAVLILGSVPGDNTVTARSEGLSGSPLTFTATGSPLPATQLVKISGEGQTGFVDSTLAEPFLVEVRNANDEPVPGVSVSFELVAGGGALSNAQPQTSGADGRVAAVLTLGSAPGENRVTASSTGLVGSPLTFTATGIPLPPTQLVKISGDQQSGLTDSTLAEPLVVEVRNATDEPVAGVSVTFEVASGEGGLSTLGGQVTGTDGRVSAILSLGSVPGENTVTVRSDGLSDSPLTFTATGLALPATQLVEISGGDQTGFVDSTLTEPFLVEVRNANNEPVPGVSVSFELVAGGGALSNAQPQTSGADGRVAAVLTLGSVPGKNRVTASSAGLVGSPLTFTATGIPLAPTQLVKISGDQQSALIDSTLAEPLVVEVRNAKDEAVGGVSVNFSILTGGGSLSSNTPQITGLDGRASTSLTLGSSPGENRVRVESDGLAGSPISFSAIGLGLPATHLVKISGDNQSDFVQSTLPDSLVVEVRNSNEEPVSGVPVSFTVLVGSGTVSGNTPEITGEDGRASVAFTLGNTAGENQVGVQVDGLPAVGFMATGLPLPATTLVKISGDGQSGLIDSTLAQPFVVEVRNALAQPVRGVPLNFSLLTVGGSLTPTALQTSDATGRASVLLTLGSVPGENQVQVESDGLQGSPQTFSATALALPPTHLVKISGDNQLGFVEATLAEPLVVEVRAANGEAVSGVAVTYEAISGGGSLSNTQPTLTDANGRASTELTLGSFTGVSNVRVTSPGLTGSPLFFTAIGQELPATQLVRVSGDNQTAFVDSSLSEPFIVEVRNDRNQPVPGVSVSFELDSGGGSLSGTGPLVTGADGRASSTLTLGSDAGEHRVRAESDGLSGSPMIFTASALALPATQLVRVSGDGQTGLINSPLPEPFLVEVRNVADQPVSGVEVRFELLSGGGALSEAGPVTTGADGRAATVLTFGSQSVENQVRVSSDGLAGSPIIFTATASALPPTQLVKISGDQQSGFEGSTLPEPLVVEVRNVNDDPVSGVPVSFMVDAGGGSLSPVGPLVTGADGRVAATLTLGNSAGENLIRVESTGLAGSPITFKAMTLSLPASKLVKVSGDNQSALVDSALAEPLLVEVRNANDNPVAGVPVTFSVLSGGGTLSASDPLITGADGRVLATFTVGGVAGQNRVEVVSEGLDGSPLLFTAAGLSLPPTQLVRISGDNQIGFTDALLSEPLLVEVRNANAEPVAGVGVTFQVTSGGGGLSEAQSTTDAFGRASAALTLGSFAGVNNVKVTSGNLSGSPLFFTAIGRLPATQLVQISGDNQSAFVDSTLQEPLVVEARNANNAPVSDVEVRFSIVSGGGSLSTTVPQITGPDGRTSIDLTLGAVAGESITAARLTDSTITPVFFVARAIPLPPTQLARVSGHGQTALVNAQLAQPFVVEVRNVIDQPVEGVVVTFTVTAGGGAVSANSDSTDASGRASVFLTLGGAAVENQVTVESPGLLGSPMLFAATGLPLPASQIVKISGDGQSALIDSTLAEPLVVEVRNAKDEPVSGVSVIFELLSEDGILSPTGPQLSGPDGRVSSTLTVGGTVGENQVRVESDGLTGSPLTFSATGLPLPASQIVKISGDGQSALIDSTLAAPLVVEVRNAKDEPVSGVSVIFELLSGDGILSPSGPQLSGPDGRVSSTLTVGGTVGENQVRVESDGLTGSPLTFSATGLPLPASQIVKISGDGQSALIDSTLAAPLVVEVRNAKDEPVSGVSVIFELLSGDGILSPSGPQLSGPDGRISSTLTVGGTVGENQVRVQSDGLSGSPLTFSAAGLPLPASQIVKISGDGQSALIDSTLAAPLVVEVRNAKDEPVSGVSVIFEVLSGDGILSTPGPQLSGPDGRVSSILTVGGTVGENQVRVESDGLSGSPLTFSATGLPLPASQIVKISGDGQSALVDSTLAAPLVVEVRNAKSEPVSGVSVIFELLSGDGILSTIGPQLSGPDGRVSSTLTVGGTVGENQVRVESDGLSGSPLTFSATATALPATELLLLSGNNQAGPIGTTLLEKLLVRVVNINGAPVSGVEVTFAVTSGGGTLSTTQPQATDANGRAETLLTLGSTPGAHTVTVSADGLIGSPVFFHAMATDFATELTFEPKFDSFVRSTNPSATYGTKPSMYVVNSSTVYHAYLKFDLTGLAGSVRDATLRLFCVGASNDGGSIYAVSNDYNETTQFWSENALNWNKAPEISGDPIDSVGKVGTNSFVELDLTPAITRPGVYSFAIKSSSTDLVKYSSKEGSEPPQLVVTQGQLGPPTQLAMISGDNQFGIAGTSLAEPFVVEARDAFGFPVSNVAITFAVAAGDGSLLDNQPQLTDANGRVSTTLSLGSIPGENVVEVSSEGLGETVAFSATGLAPPVPTQLIVVSGSEQAGAAGSTLNDPLVVRVLGSNDEPVAGVAVTFQVISGGGNVSTGESWFTDVSGEASTFLTLGPTPGENRVEASSVGLTGSPIIFTANAIVAPFTPAEDAYVRSSRARSNYGSKPEIVIRKSSATYHGLLKFHVTGLAGPVRDARLRLYVVDGGPDGGKLYSISNSQDGSNTPWNEDQVTWSNAPLLEGNPIDATGSVQLNEWVEFDVTTTVDGNGTFSFGLKNQSSDRVKYSTKEGVQAPQLLIDAGEAGPPTQLVMISGNNQTGVVGSQLSEPFVVEVRDAGNLPVAGVEVSFFVKEGGGSLSISGPQQTGFDGRALSRLTLGSTAGPDTVTVTASGLAGTPLIFTALAEERPVAVELVKISGDAQTAFAGTVLPAPLVVRTLDSTGTAVPGVPVSFAIIAGNGTLSTTDPPLTNQNGDASTVLTLGAVADTVQVTATVDGLIGSPVFFTATGMPAPTSLTFQPIGDTFVRSSKKRNNYGDRDDLIVRTSSSKYRVFLKFHLTGLTGPIGSARIRLYVEDGGDLGGTLHSVSNNYDDGTGEWTEDGLIWSNAPPPEGDPLDEVGPVQTKQWAEFDVSSALSGDGIYSFRIKSTSSNLVRYTSKEGNKPPELVVDFGSLAKVVDRGGDSLEAGTQPDSPKVPDRFELVGNYPNPFNPETTIEYTLPQASQVRVSIHNLLGQEVRVLLEDFQEAGYRKIRWNGRDQDGSPAASGIYLVQLQSRGQSRVRKITLMK